VGVTRITGIRLKQIVCQGVREPLCQSQRGCGGVGASSPPPSLSSLPSLFPSPSPSLGSESEFVCEEYGQGARVRAVQVGLAGGCLGARAVRACRNVTPCMLHRGSLQKQFSKSATHLILCCIARGCNMKKFFYNHSSVC
jgi:hypothetical protein